MAHSQGTSIQRWATLPKLSTSWSGKEILFPKHSHFRSIICKHRRTLFLEVPCHYSTHLWSSWGWNVAQLFLIPVWYCAFLNYWLLFVFTQLIFHLVLHKKLLPLLFYTLIIIYGTFSYNLLLCLALPQMYLYWACWVNLNLY